MASAFDTDVDSSSSEDSGSETSSSVSGQSSASEIKFLPVVKQPCKYYNSGGCRDGANCSYPHICKYYLQGKCRNGAACKLSHSVRGGGRGGGGGGGGRTGGGGYRPQANVPSLSDGRTFQWQLNHGKGWKDIENDHVIEAQYSLPHTKSIKLYNTEYGAVCIDFSNIQVVGKNLEVQRLDDGKSTWSWFCTLRRKWIKYGEKDSQGHSSPISSADIESTFQNNPGGSYSFTMGGNTVEIRFREMVQVSQSRRRRVTRRPQFRNKQAKRGISPVIAGVNRVSVGSRPQWEFEGNRGTWHIFKHRSGTSTNCSIASGDIEAKYQQNSRGTVTFTVGGHCYKLDLGAMIQTNMATQRTRRIRRVMV